MILDSDIEEKESAHGCRLLASIQNMIDAGRALEVSGRCAVEASGRRRGRSRRGFGRAHNAATRGLNLGRSCACAWAQDEDGPRVVSSRFPEELFFLVRFPEELEGGRRLHLKGKKEKGKELRATDEH